MVVGIYCGASKADHVDDYLHPLVSEMKDILDNGVCIDGRQISIKLRAIIAGAPTRAFIKGVAYHNGIHACMKCKIMGRSYQRRMTYEGTAEERMDEEFRRGAYCIGHQKKPTPLLAIKSLDIVRDVPTSDDLHLVNIGNTQDYC
uniref:Uncharacterized protein n=1 Tax=Anopheles epiroticus TaxID=199890 RepID=A0A182PX90_9DIPT